MKRLRINTESTILYDDEYFYILKNLDTESLISLSLTNKLFRLFSLHFIRERVKTTECKRRLENMINRCFFYQPFIILYQKLYIIEEEKCNVLLK